MNWLRRGSDPKEVVTSPSSNNNKRGLLVGGLGRLLGPGKAKANAEAGEALRLAAVTGRLGELGRLLEVKHCDPNAADEV